MLAPEPSAWLFAAGTLAATCLHVVLIFGAPIGFMTLGGRNPGVLPASARLASLFQIVLLASMAVIVLTAAGLITTAPLLGQRWLVWIIVGISALSLIANTITPSRKERWFGMPVGAALLIGSLGVALGG